MKRTEQIIFAKILDKVADRGSGPRDDGRVWSWEVRRARRAGIVLAVCIAVLDFLSNEMNDENIELIT